jgi:hypothetical protein
MKRTVLIVLIGLTTAYSALSQQSLSLSFSGPTNWTPGTSIVLNTTDSFLNFGGSYGLHYWLQAQSLIAPFLTITGLTFNSPFPDGSGLGTFPFTFTSTVGADPGYMTTLTANGQNGDLGAYSNPLVVIPDGTYANITNITFSLAANAAVGTYTLRTTTASQRPSVQIAANLDDVLFPQASFVFTVVPEPSTLALIALTGIGAGVMAYRRRN